MKTEKSSSKATRNAAIILCLIGIVSLVIAQITYSTTATNLEVTLFNVLQFIFSLVFAWLLSSMVSENQFKEAQRKFAISAFRRIKEIEKSLLRLQSHLASTKETTHEKLKETISIIRVGLASAQDNVRSSIADWSDIIGNEIEVANELSRLKSLREELGDIESRDTRGTTTQSLTDRLDKIDEKINQLNQQLPSEILNSLDIDEDDINIEDYVDALQNEMKDKGYLTFEAYWESSDSFLNDPSTLSIGDKITLERRITKNRSDVILIVNKHNKSVGVLLNKLYELGGNYGTFCQAMTLYFDKSLLREFNETIEGEVTSIEKRQTHEDAEITQHFTVKIRS